MCDLDTTGTPSIFKIISSISTLSRILPIFDFNWEENVHGDSGNVHCLNSQGELLLVIVGIKEITLGGFYYSPRDIL